MDLLIDLCQYAYLVGCTLLVISTAAIMCESASAWISKHIPVDAE